MLQLEGVLADDNEAVEADTSDIQAEKLDNKGVDVAVMEVGIGGQYEFTNAVRKPVVCGVASQDIDHQVILGSTIKSIAWHKSDIIKNDVPAVTVPQDDAAIEAVRLRAVQRNVPVSVTEPLPVRRYRLSVPTNVMLDSAQD
ncbi:Folylpolyglutamate synthetase [Coemansia sp. IMI 203386]|nr:Folylpolyglutamate synthetase [Coemansia sp. IMI 203386]